VLRDSVSYTDKQVDETFTEHKVSLCEALTCNRIKHILSHIINIMEHMRGLLLLLLLLYTKSILSQKKFIKPLMSNDTLMIATGRINKNSKFL